MSLIAAFMWKKHPRCSISTLILESENMEVLSKSDIHYFTTGYLRFRRESKKTIKNFFAKIEKEYKTHKTSVTLEYKIVFHALHIPYLSPSKESKYVAKVFANYLKKTKKKIKMEVKPQLRNRLSGKSLKQFKRELRSLYLVSRKKHTNYEYHLWTIALHATKATYASKLQKIRLKLIDKVWYS